MTETQFEGRFALVKLATYQVNQKHCQVGNILSQSKIVKLVILICRVGERVESALSALAAIFLAPNAVLTIFVKKYRILTSRDKRESYLIVLQQNNV